MNSLSGLEKCDYKSGTKQAGCTTWGLVKSASDMDMHSWCPDLLPSVREKLTLVTALR